MDSASSGSSGERSGKRKREQSPLKQTTEEQHRTNKKVTRSLSDLQDRLVAILECPVCMDLMKSPIFQCSSGHSFCSNCIKRVPQCPVCNTSVSNPVRNIGLEQLSEEVTTPCSNYKHGCQDKVFGKRDPHHNCCPFREYNCPISQSTGMHCFWKGPHSRLLEHAREAHPKATFNGNTIPCTFELKSMFRIDVKFLQSKESLFIYYTQYNIWQNKVSFAVQYAGPSDTASKFAYRLKFVSPTKSRKIVYTGEVHAIDDDIPTLFDTDDCFTTNEQQMKLFKAPNEECKFKGKLTIICV